jgi:glucokinase
MQNTIVVGADIGGSHITTAIINPLTREILQDTIRRSPVNADTDVAGIIEAWCTTIIKTAGKFDQPEQLRIGVAMPGPFDYTAGISLMKGQGKYDALYGLNVRQLMSDRLGINPENIYLENDACSFIKGEILADDAIAADRVIAITLGTGLGTASCINGHYTDENLWCMPLKDSIAEEYLSTRWFTKRFYELTGVQLTGVQQILNQQQYVAEAKQIFTEFTGNLADFISLFLEKCPADTVIIGGNIAKAWYHFILPLQQILHAKYPSFIIRQAILWEQAALLGAAGQFIEKTRYTRAEQ